jgi:hypothetical protein
MIFVAKMAMMGERVYVDAISNVSETSRPSIDAIMYR